MRSIGHAALDGGGLPAGQGDSHGSEADGWGRFGTKRYPFVDANGTQPGLRLDRANYRDSRMLAATLTAVPGVRTGRRRRPGRRPERRAILVRVQRTRRATWFRSDGARGWLRPCGEDPGRRLAHWSASLNG